MELRYGHILEARCCHVGVPVSGLAKLGCSAWPTGMHGTICRWAPNGHDVLEQAEKAYATIFYDIVEAKHLDPQGLAIWRQRYAALGADKHKPEVSQARPKRRWQKCSVRLGC